MGGAFIDGRIGTEIRFKCSICTYTNLVKFHLYSTIALMSENLNIKVTNQKMHCLADTEIMLGE
jgi:hypothetical protein